MLNSCARRRGAAALQGGRAPGDREWEADRARPTALVPVGHAPSSSHLLAVRHSAQHHRGLSQVQRFPLFGILFFCSHFFLRWACAWAWALAVT